MASEKFNPIAKLPILPGSEIANDDLQTSIIDATYPPIDGPNEKMKPQIEVRVKPAKSTESTDRSGQIPGSKRLAMIRLTILISLIVLVLAGILLTLQLVPKVMSSLPNVSQSFAYLFNSKKSTTATSTQYVALVPMKETPAAKTPAPIVKSPTPAVVKTESPAKLVANIVSTTAVGNRVQVVFDIQNVGGKTSGAWSFSATLPSQINPKYYSVLQSPLLPQSGVINTLTFTADQDLPIQISINQ